MNCHSHASDNAVATCVDCGRGLCGGCLALFTIPQCKGCHAKNLDTGLRELKRELGITAVAFFVGCLFGLPLALRSGFSFGLGAMLSNGLSFVAIRYGWPALSALTSNVFLFLPLIGWAIYFCVKLFVAMPVGLVVGPYKLYSSLKMFNKLRAIENQMSINQHIEG